MHSGLHGFKAVFFFKAINQFSMKIVTCIRVTVIDFCVCIMLFLPFDESGRDQFFCCCQPRNNLVMAVLCQYCICAVFDTDSKVRIKTILPFI